MNQNKNQNPTYLAALFIAGNTIGASILGLPVILGLAGFFPGLCVLVLLWLMMLSSGLILVNQKVLHRENYDLATLYKNVLGKFSQYIVTIGYLFLFYGGDFRINSFKIKRYLTCLKIIF